LSLSVQLEAVTFLELKPLTAEQLPAVVELDQLCFGGIWTLEGYQRELVSPNSDLLVLNMTSIDSGSESDLGDRQLKTPEKSDNPKFLIGLGCSWAILEEAHITLLAVHPNYRREGLGLLLLITLLQLSQRRQLERATLEVRASNHAACSLYQKLGFQEAGRRRRYYKDSDEDALILWRSGLQTPEFTKILEDCHKSVGNRLMTKGWQLLM
jgi:ribosomal-protein-alanine N-acetyltransferase